MTRPTSEERTPVEKLERFLLGSIDDLPELDTLRRLRLAPYAYTRLPVGHPLKTPLKSDFLAATSRHQRIKAELLPLLRAWQAAGIEVLLFKGFYLAEFVYNMPAERSYGDVDLLMWAEQAELAAEIAKRQGWAQSYSSQDAAVTYVHEVMHLDGPSGTSRLDVHRRILQNYAPWYRVQQRLTKEAWQAAQLHNWDGVLVRLLQPVDTLLMGLILGRFWSEDDWRFKMHDYLDFKTLVDTYGITFQVLSYRAEELGCKRTLELFLERCNPFEERFDVNPPTNWQLQRWNLTIQRERNHPGFERLAGRLLRAPAIAVDIARELPGLVRVLQHMRRQRDVRKLLQELEPPPVPRQEVPERVRQRLLRGINWSLRLLRVRPGANCLPRSLALFVALRQRGLPVVFCSGVRRQSSKLEGHAWVELDGVVLGEINEFHNRAQFKVNFMYPAEDEPR